MFLQLKEFELYWGAVTCGNFTLIFFLFFVFFIDFFFLNGFPNPFIVHSKPSFLVRIKFTFLAIGFLFWLAAF